MQGGGARGLRVTTTAVALMLAMVPAGCADDDAPVRAAPQSTETSTTTTSSTTTTTTEATTTTVDPDAAEFEPLYADPDLDVEAQIEAAYLHHWDILLDALRHGRTDYLPLVYTDEALQMRTEEIEDLLAEGIRGGGHVEHNYAINVHGPDSGNVIDGYWNHLVKVDPVSGEAISEPSGEQIVHEFVMVKEEDRWLVSEVVRHRFS